MGESGTHISYVNNIYDYVKKLVPINNTPLILIDSPYTFESTIPVMNGFRPDVFYKINNTLIIGEAKTDNDVDRQHSINQYYSYLKEAELFEGKSIIIFCVSWRVFANLKNQLRFLKKKNNFTRAEIIVINDKGDVSKL